MRIDAIEHGAIGDGVTNDAPAINEAIQTVGKDGAVVLSAGRTFKIASSLGLAEGVTLLGAGAILLSDTLNASALILDTGTTVEGLRLIGPALDVAVAPTSFPRSCAIEIPGHGAGVNNCRFQGYTCGGIKVTASSCQIRGNHFDGVRHYNARGIPDWLGVIYMVGSDNIISDNIIDEMWDSGIQIKGGDRNQVIGNRIICSRHSNATQSMGMRVNHGGQNNLIANNVVRYARQESISLASPAGMEVAGNIISGNILLDGRWAGIALAARGGAVNRNIISHNSIRAVEYVWDLGIILNTRKSIATMYNLIEGNMLYGEMVDGISQLQRGIHLYGPGTHGNQIANNRVTNVRFAGIDCAGSDTLVSGNYVEGCETGINATYCPGSLITANVVRRSRTSSIRVHNNVEGLVVRGNTLDMLETFATGTSRPRGTYVAEDNFVV